MRSDNLVMVALGLAALAFALVAILRWGGLPVRTPALEPEPPDPLRGDPAPVDHAATDQATTDEQPDRSLSTGGAFAAAVWSLASVLSAAIVAGALIGGVFARVIMRVAGGLSPERVQGFLTEAEENVGEITFGGSLFLIIFVGMFAGVLAAAIYLVARPWLPATARAAGAMVGVLVLGLLGPGNALDPENIDFEILSYDSLVVALALVGTVIFGMAFASLAVRFDQASRGTSWTRWLLLGGFVIFLFPPLVLAAVIYVGGRTLAPGKLRAVLDRRPVQVVGRVLLMALFLAAVVQLAVVSVGIISIT